MEDQIGPDRPWNKPDYDSCICGYNNDEQYDEAKSIWNLFNPFKWDWKRFDFIGNEYRRLKEIEELEAIVKQQEEDEGLQEFMQLLEDGANERYAKNWNDEIVAEAKLTREYRAMLREKFRVGAIDKSAFEYLFRTYKPSIQDIKNEIERNKEDFKSIDTVYVFKKHDEFLNKDAERRLKFADGMTHRDIEEEYALERRHEKLMLERKEKRKMLMDNPLPENFSTERKMPSSIEPTAPTHKPRDFDINAMPVDFDHLPIAIVPISVPIKLQLIWDPKEDITAWELAYCVKYINMTWIDEQLIDLTRTELRHFKIIKHGAGI